MGFGYVPDEIGAEGIMFSAAEVCGRAPETSNNIYHCI